MKKWKKNMKKLIKKKIRKLKNLLIFIKFKK